MITIEWENEQMCDNCGETKPHCAKISIPGKTPTAKKVNPVESLLCSDCVEDLKKRLS
jgi:hypothetical protein